MKKNDVFGYIRVSDTKQVNGASLSEQERAILEYAQKNNLNLIKWFEETKTAAKRGRPKFNDMLTLLKGGRAIGVIMHKIDRSARNLHDWAAVGDLIDNGIQVHFAHESLDMTERGGRLSADIQAVMASDYVRNLRQEIVKGIYGRLNQGIYPFGAPIGYLNNGKGKLKTIDPIKAPLVIKLFELYQTRKYNFKTLSEKIYEMGLTNLRGNKLGEDGVSKVLNNPFYTGLMKVKGKLYQGNHESILDMNLFKRVQLIIKNRTTGSGLKNFYLFRRKLKCGDCGYTMSGEMQKKMVYYRCHQKDCPTKTIREDHAEQYFLNTLNQIQLHDSEYDIIHEFICLDREFLISEQKATLMTLEKKLISLEKKLDVLLDAYLENKIDDTLYEKRRTSLLIDITSIKQQKNHLTVNKCSLYEEVIKYFELCRNPVNIYLNGNQEEKRDIIEIITSNFEVFGKSLVTTTYSIFNLVANRSNLRSSAQQLGSSRKPLPQDYPSKHKYSNMFTSPILYPPTSKIKLRLLLDTILENKNELQKNHPSTK